jgi:undecaprenyl diphosphate synthase
MSEVSSVPVHVGVIMDGNGRWAKKKGLSRVLGHKQGAENVRKLMHIFLRYKIQYVTLYAFSSENWTRPNLEVKSLMRLFEFYFTHYIQEFEENEIRFLTIGEQGPLPASLKKAIAQATQRTQHFSKATIILALNYGSRLEIVQAVQRYAIAAQKGIEDPSTLSWDHLSKYLYTAAIPDPDLIIRTSGENRLSNFLLLQAAYAELYFTDISWPEFDEAEFVKALNAYRLRDRRFGSL